ncbi:endonuclease/exonuclease/phosphatase family protein [Mangrovihabitans endophyticus]|nr:endonuclease/exonuclease/phosphatase family protein [Mangrovihabitans endophyticus]
MTWNIKNGGGDRLDAVLAVVHRHRPDLLALQELRGFARRGGLRMQRFAASAGMHAHLAPSVFGQPVAVLARPPLRLAGDARVRWRLHHAASVAVVPTGAGPLTVVSTHLNPFSPERRRREARWLAARYGGTRRLTLLAGDLNSLAPRTDHTATIERLAPAYRGRHVGPDGRADTRAVAAFAADGLVDLWTVAGSGDGRTVPTTAGGGAEFSGMRLDYVLGTADVARRVRRVTVLRGAETEYASDHYPVLVELDINPGAASRTTRSRPSRLAA